MWLDHHLPLGDVLDAPASVLAVVIATIHARREGRDRAAQENADREDARAGELMHGILDRIETR